MSPNDRLAAANREEFAERLSKHCINEGCNPVAEGLQFYRHPPAVSKAASTARGQALAADARRRRKYGGGPCRL